MEKKLKGSANADKLFRALLVKLDNTEGDIENKFTVKEIASIIPIGTEGISNPATYGFSFTSMLSNQKNRDYFIFNDPRVQEHLTILAKDPNRNNYYWKSHFGSEKLIINPKYLNI